MKRFYDQSFKGTILFSLLVLFTLTNYAATYYVSNSGNDSNSGLTSAAPWQTLSKVNAANLVAGDQVLFQKGNTFYGSLTVKNSGASGSPITFGAYGSGANPLITGFTTVGSWVSLGSSIWESTGAVSTLSACNMVTVNDVNTAQGRYPNTNAANSGYLFFQSHGGSTSITSSSLSGSPNWTGAEAVVRSSSYTMDVVPITSQSGGSLNFGIATSYTPTDGWGFFIQNDARTLDQQNEWYYNPSTKKIRVFSSTQPSSVKVASVENLLTVNGNYITINGLDFTGANTNAIFTSSTTLTNTTILNSNISFSGRTGIKFRSNGLTIENNTVQHSNNRGMDIAASRNAVVRNNTIRHSGMLPGMAIKKGFDGIWAALYIGGIYQLTCEYNTVINSGYNAISFGGDGSDLATIRNNFIDTFCSILDDGGGIYGGKNSTIENNIVINGIGAIKGSNKSAGNAMGIYLDDNSQNNKVLNNSIANANYIGLYLHNASNNVITGNTVYNSGAHQFVVHDDGGTGTIENNTISNNIFVAKNASQFAAQYRFSSSFHSLGTVNYNYYLRPIAETSTIRVTSSAGAINYTLAGWQSYSKHDLNSQKSPLTITNESDLQFEYNSTKTTRTVALSGPMMDAKGTKYSGSITLQPFTAAVLIRDGAPTAAVAPGAPTSVVATAGNATASVTFAAPTNNGGSVITGYTVTSLPAGGTDLNAGSPSLTHSISGLTNGTAYTFTVRATNSAGSSVASAPSNSVIPTSAVAVGSNYTLTGPTSGNVNSAATFIVDPANVYTGTITITPSGPGSIGLSPKVLTYTASSSSQSFTFTPQAAGSITFTATNNGGLTNPAPLNFTANAVVSGVPGFTLTGPSSGNVNVETSFFVDPTNVYTGTFTITPTGTGSVGLSPKVITYTASHASFRFTFTPQVAGSITLTATNNGGLTNPAPLNYTVNAVTPVVVKDITAPVISAFSIPSYASSMMVPIFAFTASDNMGVSGYLVTESSSAPAPGASGWSNWVPTVYNFSSPGSKTLYAWVKDAAGNVSASRSDQVKISKVNRLKNGNNLESGEADMLFEQMDEPISEIDVFPNPTMGRITVRFSTPTVEGSRIDILDLAGRVVDSRIITGMSEEFNLDQQAPGVYLVKMTIGSEQRTEKLIITK